MTTTRASLQNVAKVALQIRGSRQVKSNLPQRSSLTTRAQSMRRAVAANGGERRYDKATGTGNRAQTNRDRYRPEHMRGGVGTPRDLGISRAQTLVNNRGAARHEISEKLIKQRPTVKGRGRITLTKAPRRISLARGKKRD